jgi:hypothetical protein
VIGNFLINPSQSVMAEFALRDSEGFLVSCHNELRAIITESDDLYVWHAWDGTHWEFAGINRLRAKAWLCIDTRRNRVRLSGFSHGGENLHDRAQSLKEHHRLRFFQFDIPQRDEPTYFPEDALAFQNATSCP